LKVAKSFRFLGLLWGLLLLVSLTLGVIPVEVQAANLPYYQTTNNGVRYVEATGHSIIAPVAAVYDRTGGELRHGKPLTELYRDKTRYVQYFERSIFEFYSERYIANQPEAIKILPVGRLLLEDAGIAFNKLEPFEGTPEKYYIKETGHSLREPFLSYWYKNGGVENFGFPLSEEMAQLNLDGTFQIYQYFEKARLSRPLRADNPGDVRLDNLGVIRTAKKLKPEQLTRVSRDKVYAPRSLRVPSLMFHYARIVDEKRDPLGYGLSVTPENYIKFLDWTQQNGYNTVTSEQILDYFKFGILLPDKPVNFRWDDGHDNNWFVYQEMKRRNMTATFYVITKKLELTPQQWKQISDDGFEVAAHTRTHPDLRGVRDLNWEIAGSKQDLEAMLGRPVRTFCYPYGGTNNAVIAATRSAGFELAVTTVGGYGWSADKMLEQPTISVTGWDNLAAFADKVRRAGGGQPLVSSR
jgi:peptidoglycan/xylan/chitin deacetylase (PgdA/CDA1 family)